MPTLTTTTESTIEVNYSYPEGGGKSKVFLWRNQGSTRGWNEFPVMLTRSTMFIKYDGCPETITYSTEQTLERVLPTSNGPVVGPDDETLIFSLQVQLEGGDPDDDVVSIGAIKTNPRGRDWFMVPLPPQAQGQKWGKGGKRARLLTIKDLDIKTVKRLELLQKELGGIEDVAAKAKGKMK